MEKMPIKCVILLWLMLTTSVSCQLTGVEKETVLEGSVHLQTGDPVVNYPLRINSYKSSLYGRGSVTTVEVLKTNAQGTFSYKGVLKSGGLDARGYELEYAIYFPINGKLFTLDSIKADIPGQYATAPVNNQYTGDLFPGKKHFIRITLK